MSDFLSGLGGLIKGMQPLMGEEAKKDPSMNAFLMQTDLSEMETKKKEVFAKIGEAVYEANQKGRYGEFSELCEEAAQIDKQVARKRAEVQAAQQAAEEQKRADQQERDARTCPGCGHENPPGTKFCQECGEKLMTAAAAKCPKCGLVNAPGTKFCGDCGTRL